MAKVNASEFTDKWKRRMKGSSEDMRRGIDRVTEAPGVKAAAKQEKMKAKINEALDDGKWARNVAAVPLSEWKEKAKTKGIARISAGVDGASGKMQKFAGELLPHIESLQAEIENMPDMTLEDSIARQAAFTRGMAKFRKSE